MRRMSVILVVAAALMLVGSRAEALSLSPGGALCTSNINSNLSGVQIEALLESAACGPQTITDPLTLLYKAEVGGTDSGRFASAYDTVFSNTSLDPQDATISYLGGVYMDCSVCYLVVKDGQQTPAQYFFNISAWNGTETINLNTFWPGKGAISNVAIWGKATPVPEPSSVFLMGAGLGLVSLKSRRRTT